MLLDFQAKNYKSFQNGLIFSMEPAPKQKGLDYSIQKAAIGSKKYKGLSSSVIYGPNASGKTNVIGAMDTFKQIILRGNIRNTERPASPNAASSMLELIPCCSAEQAAPVEFSIRFIEKGILIEYFLSMDIGIFLQKGYRRKILAEKLSINGNEIFVRDDSVKIKNVSGIGDYLNKEINDTLPSAEKIAANGLNREELFLVNGFKTIFSKKLTALILDWITNKFTVIYHCDEMQTTRIIDSPKANTIYVGKTLTEAAEIFGISSNALGYKISDKGEDAALCSVLSRGGKKIAIPAEIFESYGTIRFVNEFPLVLQTMLNGGTLVVDEFDASIHPMAIMNMIGLFHNDDINKKHAQLIFNTHNPIFLNSNLFRRDEIKFVERDDTTHESSLYSLSDFKTAGKTGVRKGGDYMKNYFINRYGAIKDIDFSPIFENMKKENNHA